jgi:hypothetical protein
MKIISYIVGFILVAGFAWGVTAAGVLMVPDGSGAQVAIQGAAPGMSSGALAKGRTSKNLTGKTWWGVYCTSDVKFRLMSTATVTGHQYTIPAGSIKGFNVNKSAAFLHYSTPTEGDYYQQ